MRILSVVALVVAMAVGNVCSAGGLMNLSFEDLGALTINPSNGFVNVPAGNALPGWIVAGTAGVDIKDGDSAFWLDAELGNGQYYVDLAGDNGNGSISQSFDLPADGEYQISFWVNSNPNNAPNPHTATVNVGGSTLAISHVPNTAWELVVFSFTGVAGANTITFASNQDPETSGGIFIDGLSGISVIPEPTSMLLSAIGIPGLVALWPARRRRK